MNPAAHIPKGDSLKALFELYRAGVPLSQAQLDCLVQHGVLNERAGTYWAGPRAAELSGGT